MNNRRDLVDESHLLGLAGEDHTIVLGLEPLHSVLLSQAVGEANLADLSSPVSDVHAWPAEDDKEVHAIDTNAWIVLNSQVNMLLDAEAEVAIVGEVLLPQHVLLHLKAPLQDFLGLGSPDCAVNGDFLVSPDTEATNSVTGLGEHWGLSSQRLQPPSPGFPR